MKQEDYNEIMSDFHFFVKPQDVKTKTCPKCNQKYLGDGKEPCVDCEISDFMVKL